jgi:Inner membrane component of T3SS, cytoplasmic domain
MAEVKNICLEALERHCESGDVGRLDFRRGNYEGHILTDQRLIVHAQIANLEGIPALFRLFDWGDAETTWVPGTTTEKPSLHLTMEAASQLYAEHLQERAEIEERDKDRIDPAFFAPESVAGQITGVESVLKAYTVSLECTTDPTLLPGGFTFADSTKSSYVIGSSDDCDVILRNPTVDPLHCGVILERGAVLIWDLGAQSGVLVNGNPVSQDILKVGDIMTLGTLDLRVRFQLRRPNIKPKTTAMPEGVVAVGPAAAGPVSATGTMPLPTIGPPSKEVPKGAITYDKVVKQLKSRGTGESFLTKLGSLFGAKKKK